MKTIDSLQLDNRKNAYIYPAFGLLCFCMSALFVFLMTGFTPNSGFNGTIQSAGVTLIPITGITDIIATSAENGDPIFALSNIGGNIILFMPFGFFLPLLWRNYRSGHKIAIAGMCLSTMIEISQLFIHRGTDVDDVILNTIGTCVGYLVFKGVQKSLPTLAEKTCINRFSDTCELTYGKKKGLLMPWILIASMFAMIMGISYIGCIL